MVVATWKAACFQDPLPSEEEAQDEDEEGISPPPLVSVLVSSIGLEDVGKWKAKLNSSHQKQKLNNFSLHFFDFLGN